MDLFILKIIGIISMFADHYEYIIGGSEILSIIGRIAFPIFAFALTEGYVHTGNIKKYFFRLGLSAVIIQAIMWILHYYFNYTYQVNIFFTLFTGLLCIHIWNYKKNEKRKNEFFILKILLIILLFYVSDKLEFDYGIYGLLMIIIFYAFRGNKIKIFFSFLILNGILVLYPQIFSIMKIQVYSIVALIPIFLYNGKKGRNIKYFFYIFYPVHFFVLEIIKYLIDLIEK